MRGILQPANGDVILEVQAMRGILQPANGDVIPQPLGDEDSIRVGLDCPPLIQRFSVSLDVVPHRVENPPIHPGTCGLPLEPVPWVNWGIFYSVWDNIKTSGK